MVSLPRKPLCHQPAAGEEPSRPAKAENPASPGRAGPGTGGCLCSKVSDSTVLPGDRTCRFSSFPRGSSPISALATASMAEGNHQKLHGFFRVFLALRRLSIPTKLDFSPGAAEPGRDTSHRLLCCCTHAGNLALR